MTKAIPFSDRKKYPNATHFITAADTANRWLTQFNGFYELRNGIRGEQYYNCSVAADSGAHYTRAEIEQNDCNKYVVLELEVPVSDWPQIGDKLIGDYAGQPLLATLVYVDPDKSGYVCTMPNRKELITFGKISKAPTDEELERERMINSIIPYLTKAILFHDEKEMIRKVAGEMLDKGYRIVLDVAK